VTDTDWPPAVEALNVDGASELVLLCEHASNHIPETYQRLGLPASELTRHIAWDPGAADVTRRLSALLDAPAYLGAYSRLLIDLNRPLASPGSIVTRSEATDIPGNFNLSAEDRMRRADTIFRPFHDRISAVLDRRQKDGRPVRLVSIHSFTPVYLGETRAWQAGVLFGEATGFGLSLVEKLRRLGVTAGANVPYESSRDEDYAVPVHGDDRGIPAVLIEIRNDLIAGPDAVTAWADKIFMVLSTS
jgi:predicted N-formylglutamate amidohydrolase